jgi:serine/threonine protein kinase
VRAYGKYRLIEPIACGGMAEVWRAEAPGPEGFVKEVALKLVRAGAGAGAGGDFVKMFVHEARLASRLTHANIVQVFDFDEVDGEYYIAMELVRGKTLREVLDRCRGQGVRLGLPRAVHIVAEVARALAYAHGLEDGGRPVGLVHRDVSPQNVLLSFEGEVKLADFGIARAMDAVEVTAPGAIKGKAAYMAPEQARGEDVDARADVFAAGVVLWELCSGRRLFARDSEANTLAALLGGDPPSPPSAWNEEVPAELDTLVMGALERDPARRTRSAEELSQGLAELRLRLAARANDLDLRAFMRRLWPRGPEPVRRKGQTIVCPASPVPAARVQDELSTRTLQRPAGGEARRSSLLAVLVAGCLAAGALGGSAALARREGKGSPWAAAALTTSTTTAPHPDGPAAVRPVLNTSPAVTAPHPDPAAAARRDLIATTPQHRVAFADPTRPAARPAPSLSAAGEAPAMAASTAEVPRPRSRTPVAAAIAMRDRAPRPMRADEPGSVGDPDRSRRVRLDERRSAPGSASHLASSTLARGTLVQAKLARGIDPAQPGVAEAVVTDDVLSGGTLIVPRGSTVACRFRPSKDGRVPVSCESIKTADRIYSFSGLAVGEGQRVGLPALDTEVPAGTPFVIYVNASAPLR